jgi:probable O-glycosylation ligase (exosortase A-associated)
MSTLGAAGPASHRHTQIVYALGATAVVAAGWLAMPAIPVPAAAFLIAAAPVGVWVLFRAPLALVVGFVLFSLFRIHEVILPLKPLRIPLMLSLGALAGLALMIVTRRLKPFLTPELRLLLVFAGVVTLQIPFASNPGLALTYWIDSYSKIVLMAFAIGWMVGSPAQLKQILRAMTLVGAGIAGVAIFNSLNGIGMVEGTRVTINRAEGSALGDPNDLAMVLLFPIGFAVSLLVARTARPWERVLGGLALPVLVWGLLATQSRGGLLGVMAVIGVFAWNRVRNKALLLVGGGVAGVALFIAAGIGERSVVQEGGGVGEIDASAEGRLHAWEAAINMAIARPLTGVGIDNFVENFYFYTPHWGGMAKAVHSTWFQALGESGFVGFGLFVALVALTALSGLSTWRRLGGVGRPEAEALRDGVEAVLAALAGFCVAGTFLTQAFTWPFYILLAFLVAGRRMAAGFFARTVR